MFTYFKLFRNRTFALFFTGNVISLIGWGFNFIAVGWIVLEQTGSKLALGKLNAITMLPGLAIAVYAGAIIDRMNRKHLLVFLDLMRMAAVAVIPILMWLSLFKLWHLYIMAFMIGLGSSMFWPAASAFTQEIVGEKEYLPANALLSASFQTGSLLGSALGGFVIYWFGVETALMADAVTYLLSATLIGSARHISAISRPEHESVTQTFKAGFAFIRKEKLLFGFGISSVFADVAIWGNFTILTIAFSVDVLNAGTRGFGLMDGAYGVGALLATFLALGFSRRIQRKILLSTAYAVAGLMTFMIPWFPWLGAAMGLFLIIGVHNNSARIFTRTVLMENVPNRMMGRFQTINGVMTRLLIIMSTLVIGWLVENRSVNFGLHISAIWFWISLAGVFIVNRMNPHLLDPSLKSNIALAIDPADLGPEKAL